MTDQSTQTWLNAIIMIAKHYRKHVSEESIRLDSAWIGQVSTDDSIGYFAQKMGLKYQVFPFATKYLDHWHLPLILQFQDDKIAILQSLSKQGEASLQFVEEEGLIQSVSLADIASKTKSIHIFRPEKSVQDSRVDEYIKPFEKNWFWSIVLKDWTRYIDIMFASLVANILALATIVFSMQVYDRVVPAQSIPTLWVLAGGVLIAAIFEFILRLTRTILSDTLGKRADLRVSDRVFGHALRIKNSERPKSTGTFISQIRELESVREMVTSTTISAIADLPFFFLFLAIFAVIGGDIFWVMLLVVPLMLLPALLVQKPLARLAQEGMRESSIRNAMLVEAVQGIEDIKLLRAEHRFQNQWNQMNEVSAEIGLKQRKISGFLTAWTQKIQGLTYALVVLVGCFAVMSGDMTTGALVACSILSSRMLTPISMIAGVLGRLQQAKVAKTGLDELMKKNVDYPEQSRLIHRPALSGNYQLEKTVFQYDEDQSKPNLAISALNIKTGEKIAILGKNGAGKTTLLQILAGMQTPNQGRVLLDGIDLQLLDPYDIRRDVGLLNQNAHLFYGSVRENLTLGNPMISDEKLIQLLQLTGAWSFIQAKKEGLDHLILEGGRGFSGGQKQLLLLTRLLVADPQIILLDEPTAWLDDVSEKNLIERLTPWLTHKTLIVATHRKPILAWVDRVIILTEGKIAVDGARDEVLKQQTTVAGAKG